jgi:serine/threonine-protein kinase
MPTDNADDADWLFPPPDPATEAKLRAMLRADLGSRYEVRSYLGRGAFASVWHAVDLVTGQSVAVKCLQGQPRELGGFYRELSTLFRLQHPQIVRIINLTQGAEAQYLILEFCGGGHLRTATRGAQRLDLAFKATALARLTAQMASGLAAAHELGLVHRDLKPENVLFAQPPTQPLTGVVKLADFGLARSKRGVDDGDGRLLSASGSPAYMAPEQFVGVYTPASDMYALGVMLYELWHDDLPFLGSPQELARLHSYETPPIDAGLPIEWRELLADLLAKASTQRPTAAQVIERVGPWCIDRVQRTSSASRCLGVRANQLCVSGTEVLAIGDGMIFRMAGPQQPLRTAVLTGVTHGATDAAGHLWLAGAQHVWQQAPGERQPTRRWAVPEPVTALAVGAEIVLGSASYVVAYATDGQERWRVPVPAPVSALAWRGNAILVACGPQLWEITAGALRPLPTIGGQACLALWGWPAHPQGVWGRLANGTVGWWSADGWQMPPCAPQTLCVQPDGCYGLTARGELWRWTTPIQAERVDLLAIEGTAQALAKVGAPWAVLTDCAGTSWISFLA